jgi:large subunit ribosomal protein L17
MRHLKKGRKLGRNASHRLALFRNLTMSLIRHERIITTLEKAKEVRPFVEKLITMARKGGLHLRRLVAARLGPMADAEVKPASDGEEKDADHRTVLQKLFEELGPRFKDRPGGYTRVIKRHQRRLGDGGKTAYLELLKEGEVGSRAKAPSAPRVEAVAPKVEETAAPPSDTAPATPETAQQTQGEAQGEQKAEGEQPKT